MIGKTDWEYMSNCFVILARIGFHFVKTPQGPGNTVLTQCGLDVGPIAVQVDASQEHAGIAFENCQFMATAIIGPENQGPIKFSNCGFWPIGPTKSQAVIGGKGTVTFTSCHFAGWGKDSPAINVKAGTVIVSGCEFMAGDRTQVELGPGTVSAAIFGCRFRGGEKISNNAPATAKVRMGLNIE